MLKNDGTTKPEESLVITRCGGQVGSISAFHVFNPAIVILITMCLFCACCVLNHCKMAAKMIGVFRIFTSETIFKKALAKNVSLGLT